MVVNLECLEWRAAGRLSPPALATGIQSMLSCLGRGRRAGYAALA